MTKAVEGYILCSVVVIFTFAEGQYTAGKIADNSIVVLHVTIYYYKAFLRSLSCKGVE